MNYKKIKSLLEDIEYDIHRNRYIYEDYMDEDKVMDDIYEIKNGNQKKLNYNYNEAQKQFLNKVSTLSGQGRRFEPKQIMARLNSLSNSGASPASNNNSPSGSSENANNGSASRSAGENQYKERAQKRGDSIEKDIWKIIEIMYKGANTPEYYGTPRNPASVEDVLDLLEKRGGISTPLNEKTKPIFASAVKNLKGGKAGANANALMKMYKKKITAALGGNIAIKNRDGSVIKGLSHSDKRQQEMEKNDTSKAKKISEINPKSKQKVLDLLKHDALELGDQWKRFRTYPRYFGSYEKPADIGTVYDVINKSPSGYGFKCPWTKTLPAAKLQLKWLAMKLLKNPDDNSSVEKVFNKLYLERWGKDKASSVYTESVNYFPY